MARIAQSLATLRDQIDAAYPNRKKSSDGWIGDSSHALRTSDHNPNANGVVQALDVTHDPSGGIDTYKLAEILRYTRDPRIKYVISSGKIFSSLIRPWEWRPYTGSNAHAHHIHISVDDDPARHDDPSLWRIDGQLQLPFTFAGITATVFGGPGNEQPTAYADVKPGWAGRPGAALPYRFPGQRPSVRVVRNGKSVVCPIVDVGPWNTKDPYWLTGTRPQAESGIDKTGRRTNLAGIDLTPEAARIIDLPGKGLVDWHFIQEKDMADPALTPAPAPTQSTDLAATIKSLVELAPILIALLSALKGGAPVAPVVPAPATAPPVAPAPAPANPILERPGVGTGILGGIITAILQIFGVVGASVGDAATTTGQLLPVLSLGTAALGASGWVGTALNVLKTLASLASRK